MICNDGPKTTGWGFLQEAEMLRPRVPALEAEVARLQVEVQDRNKGLRDAHSEESLARAQVPA